MTEFDEREREQVQWEAGMEVTQSRRAQPRLPAGAWQVRHSNNTIVDCMPWSEGSHPSDEHVLAGRLIARHVIACILRASRHKQAIDGTTLAALDDAFLEAFGCRPGTAVWLGAFMRELKRGRSMRYAAELRDNRPDHLIPIARTIIVDSQWVLSKCQPYGALPPWLSKNLIAFLLSKFSFTRGGGPLGALSAETTGELLADPAQMTDYLRSSTDWASGFSRELDLLANAANSANTEHKTRAIESKHPSDE